MERSSGLSPAKRALLQRRLGRAASVRREAPRIPPRPGRDTAPLSAIQRQMWLIDRMTRGNPAYNLPYGFRLRGPLDAEALERSLAEVVRRHDVLRTTFGFEGDEPLQRVHPELEVGLRTRSLEHLAPPELEERLHALATEEARRTFDLARLPLLRATLFRLTGDEHVLVMNVHHTVADGLSVGVLLDELDVLYHGFTGGEPARLPELTLQYGDYAAWQRRRLADADALAGRIDFWRAHLGTRPPVLDLPTDRPRPPLQSFAGSNVFFSVPGDLARGLKDLGAREGCTPFMTFLAAFQLLLCRASGADSVVIGTPLAVRPVEELEPLIGNFLDMAALRCDVSGDPTFLTVMRRARDTTLDALSHGGVPLDTLLEHLDVARDPSRNPLFQAMLQVLPEKAPRIGDLEVRSYHFDLGFSQLDVSLHLYEEGGGYWGRLEYCTDLFERDTVERLSADFQRLLRDVVADPTRPVSALAAAS